MSPINDRLEITELLHRHQVMIDLRDGDGYADLFAPDGRFESPFAGAEGRDEIKSMTLGLHESGFTQGKRHLIGPISVEVDGDAARAFSYWWVAEVNEKPHIFATGTYTDHLRRIDGEWKIVHRRQEADPNGQEEASAVDRA